MEMNTLLIALSAMSLFMVVSAFILLRLIEQDDKRRMRVIAVQKSVGLETSDDLADGNGLTILGMVAAIGRFLARSGLLPASTLAELESTLAIAGFRRNNALGLYIGGKLLLMAFLPVIAFVALQTVTLSPPMRNLAVAGCAILGLLAPDFFLRHRRQAHLDGVARGLPDALDLLVICSEAGLGLEAGLERVSAEIAPAHPDVASEFQITSAELRVLSDRRMALTNMGTRTGLTVMQRLGSTLVQTLQYGTPLSKTLRVLATEMRDEMQLKFEEKAVRLPVLLTIPMVLFILPSLFVVVGGPAGLAISRTVLNK